MSSNWKVKASCVFVKEHERVLKEIAEDRKVNKMMRMHGPATPAAASSDAASSTHSVAKAIEATSSSSTSAMCSLQVTSPFPLLSALAVFLFSLCH